MPKISVLIATKDRYKQLYTCIESILNNEFQDFEILILDQTTLPQGYKKFINSRVRYFTLKTVGRSKALNYGIKKAISDIIVITDDDCIVNKNWLATINAFFSANTHDVGVLGSVHPYRPKQHILQYNPSTFVRKKMNRVTSPLSIVYEELGVGSNMSFRKEVFDKYGYFKTWLGVGSVGKGAEDTEYCYRLLKHKETLVFNPHIKIYHNRWLKTKNDLHLLIQNYKIGEAAFLVYYIFYFDLTALKKLLLLYANIFDEFFREAYSSIRNYQLSSLLVTIRHTLGVMAFLFKGTAIGLYYRFLTDGR